jgi:hypothetical protein
MDKLPAQKKSFGEKADAYLHDFYKSCGADTTPQKITVLELKLGKSNFYAYGGKVTDEMKLGSLEYDFLEQRGLIKLEYA